MKPVAGVWLTLAGRSVEDVKGKDRWSDAFRAEWGGANLRPLKIRLGIGARKGCFCCAIFRPAATRG